MLCVSSGTTTTRKLLQLCSSWMQHNLTQQQQQKRMRARRHQATHKSCRLRFQKQPTPQAPCQQGKLPPQLQEHSSRRLSSRLMACLMHLQSAHLPVHQATLSSGQCSRLRQQLLTAQQLRRGRLTVLQLLMVTALEHPQKTLLLAGHHKQQLPLRLSHQSTSHRSPGVVMRSITQLTPDPSSTAEQLHHWQRCCIACSAINMFR